MKQIIGILKQLENTTGRIDKENILKQNKDNELLKKTLRYALDPFLIFGVGSKSIKEYKGKSITSELNDLFSLLDWLLENNTGTDQAKIEVNKFLTLQDEEDKEWYKRIILKNLRIGMTEKSINKIIPGLISEFNCMLAQNYFDEVDRLSGDFIVTLKLDGSRLILVRENGSNKFFTRQGQPVIGLVEIEEEANRLPDNMVYDGEILLNKDLPSKDLFRETMKVVRKDGDKKNLKFLVFDMLPLNEFLIGVSKKDCVTRKTELQGVLSVLNLKWIENVEIMYMGSDKTKVIELLNRVTEDEKEGVMVSPASGLYRTKRTKDLLKAKKFHTIDLKIVDILEGEGRNEGRMGAAVVKYKDNTVNVGSGWSDSEREEVFNNKEKYIGTVIEVSYFEESVNSKTSEVSLRFPTFVRFRPEKTEESYF